MQTKSQPNIETLSGLRTIGKNGQTTLIEGDLQVSGNILNFTLNQIQMDNEYVTSGLIQLAKSESTYPHKCTSSTEF